MSEKRVAIQFVGLVRGFRFESVRDLFYERIVKQLEMQGYTVDFFWHTYDVQFDDVVYTLDTDKFNIVKLMVDKDSDIQNFLENDYGLLSHYDFHPKWSDSRALSPRNTGISYGITNDYLKYGWFKFIYSIKKATELRIEYENERYDKSPYEWVITVAPQMEPQSNIDDLTLLDNNYMYSPETNLFGGFYTSFYIGNSEHANYMGTLYNCAIDKTLDETVIHSEPVFKRFVDKKYTIHTSLDITFNRVRYDGTRIDH